MSETVFVVAAHPDDEVLGCGATIARHIANGDRVCTLILADGVTARGNAVHLDERYESARNAAKILGCEQPRFLNYFDQKLDTVSFLTLVQTIEKEITWMDIGPTIIYTHHAGDLNLDHQITHQAVLTAYRPLPMSTVKEIYSFEVPSATGWGSGQEFKPDHFVDVFDFIDKKCAALDAYGDEIREFPNARSKRAITSLMEWRGASVGMRAAEAFMTVRTLER